MPRPTPPEDASDFSSGSGPRVHVPSLEGHQSGAVVPLSPDQARHLTRVRRLGEGASLQVFDDAGRAAPAVLQSSGEQAWSVRLLEAPVAGRPTGLMSLYAAIPKGNRADWMVEKLSELGVVRLIPILTARSVVSPGANKVDRFRRIAREAAKQSRREGVMQIEDPAPLQEAIGQIDVPGRTVVLATERPGRPLWSQPTEAVFVGPEGGWTPQELDAFEAAGIFPGVLTQTVLRVETAAICAAAVVATGRTEE